ncbi:DUF1778 domain-containing protein [Oscillatoria acuminata]|uniref:DUF1778 domain-containing protein n=1 Tax=Oscillatoria acuminata PCC 6304 TaxID=56110 RepID=K9TKE2_9CYAN|nr:DUF1778 domain-containing protein [Oscillatoria acuminata]AFY83015.1 hypothetical protein Oscil6304_3447 [Oscillatoria acuminata PCC 6304]
MSLSSPTPSTTIEIILPPDQKIILEKAAQIEGLSLSEYLLKIATERAEQSLLKSESITLSENDWERVTGALANPPEINAALKTAINRYQKHLVWLS